VFPLSGGRTVFTHHLPNVFSCTLIQLCSSTAMANTHARWGVVGGVLESAGAFFEGSFPATKWICLARGLMQIV